MSEQTSPIPFGGGIGAVIPWLVQGGLAWRSRGDSAAGGNLVAQISTRRPALSWRWLGSTGPSFDVAESLIPFDAACPNWRALRGGLGVNSSEGRFVVGLVGATPCWARPVA